MTPRDFLEQVVEPNLNELEARRYDVRLAYNAVASIDALAAHIYAAAKSSLTEQDDIQYREALAKGDPDFALIRDVAKALKHVELTRGVPKVSRADQLSVKFGAWGKSWGTSWKGWGEQSAIVTNAGQSVGLKQLLRDALEVLRAEIKRLGV